MTPNGATFDPTGRLVDLADALDEPLLGQISGDGTAESAPAQAALQVAVALGYCRLYGLDTVTHGGPLAAHLALAAARQLATRLGHWSENARRLDARLADVRDPTEAVSLASGVLQCRMMAWAALEAIHEAAAAMSTSGHPLAGPLGAAVDRVGEPLDRFDVALEENADAFVALVSGLPLMTEWETFLAGRYRDPLPWWIGDGLLAVAARHTGSAATPAAPTVFDRLPDVTPALLSAAGTARPGTLPGLALEWVSPGDVYRAEVVLPSFSTPGDEEVARRLNVTRRSDDRPASELAGQLVRIGSKAYRLDGSGVATVTLAELRAAGPPDEIFVGETPAAWVRAGGGA